MKVKSVNLKNFKRFRDDRFSFTGGPVVIDGKNGEGKSTFMEAVFFALYNRDQFNGRETGKFIRKGAQSTTVELELRGTKITRQKSSDGSSLIINERHTKQEDLDKAIPSLKVFASVFAVGQFFAEGESDQREHVLSMLPAIDHMMQYYELDGTKELEEKYKLSFDDITAQKKELRRLAKNNTAQIERHQYKMEFFKENPIITKYPTSSKSIKELEKENDVINGKIRSMTELQANLSVRRSENDEWNGYLSQLEEFKSRKKANEEGKKELDVKKAALFEEYGDKESLLNNIRTLTDNLEALDAQIFPPPVDENCPVCDTHLSKSDLLSAKKRSAEINAKKKLLQGTIQTHRDALQHVVAEETKLNVEETIYEQELVKPLAPFKDAPEPLPENYEEISTTMVQLSSRQVEITIEIRDETEMIEAVAERNKEIATITEEAATLEQDVLDLKFLIGVFDQMPLLSLKDQEATIRKGLQDILGTGIDIVLKEKLASGTGTKETFKIKWNGIDYKMLSTGEKKIVEFAMSIFLNSLLEKPIDMYFIDHGESISNEPFDGIRLRALIPDDSQVFIATTTPDTLLKITDLT